ncbi:MAG TPA: hypothetical protein VGG64_23345 [Pirellulales bacterium]|jgi:hypothetical protein
MPRTVCVSAAQWDVKDGIQTARIQSPRRFDGFGKKFTEERSLHAFRHAFDREPTSEVELDLFIENLTLEMYNSGLED